MGWGVKKKQGRVGKRVEWILSLHFLGERIIFTSKEEVEVVSLLMRMDKAVNVWRSQVSFVVGVGPLSDETAGAGIGGKVVVSEDLGVWRVWLDWGGVSTEGKKEKGDTLLENDELTRMIIYEGLR